MALAVGDTNQAVIFVFPTAEAVGHPPNLCDISKLQHLFYADVLQTVCFFAVREDPPSASLNPEP